MLNDFQHDSFDGDVMQIDIRTKSIYAGCFISVIHKMSWGVLGYITLPEKQLIQTRVPWKDLVHIGHAAFNCDEYFIDPIYAKEVKKARGTERGEMTARKEVAMPDGAINYLNLQEKNV